jgi:hypothetical protein
MIERLASCKCRVDPDSKALFDFYLTNELGQALGTEGELDDRFLGEGLRRGNLGA